MRTRLWQIVKIALIVALIAIPINDFGRYLTSYYNLDNITREATAEAARSGGGNSREERARTAVAYAGPRGVTVKFVDLENDHIVVKTTMPVSGLLVWGPFVAATNGVPWQRWWTTPVIIQSSANSIIG